MARKRSWGLHEEQVTAQDGEPEVGEESDRTRGSPDIAYAVQQVCLHMHTPREPHFTALKRILRYLHGSLDYGLQMCIRDRSY